MRQINEFINGNLLGDSNIRVWKSKYGNYYYYKHTAKDNKFLEWQKSLLEEFRIKTYICRDNKSTGCYVLGFYINNCPYPELMKLRKQWYIERLDKNSIKC
jgi:hypothetical protein